MTFIIIPLENIDAPLLAEMRKINSWCGELTSFGYATESKKLQVNLEKCPVLSADDLEDVLTRMSMFFYHTRQIVAQNYFDGESWSNNISIYIQLL